MCSNNNMGHRRKECAFFLVLVHFTLASARFDEACEALCGAELKGAGSSSNEEENDVPVLGGRAGWMPSNNPWQAIPAPAAYNPPPPVYRPPPVYQPPPQVYRPPPQQYQQPQTAYRPPPQQYQQPQTAFRPSPQQYQQPQTAYQPPPQQYQQPQNGYRPPPSVYNNQFNPPPLNRPNRQLNLINPKYGPDGYPIYERAPTANPKIVDYHGNAFRGDVREALRKQREEYRKDKNCAYKWGVSRCVPNSWLEMEVPPRPIWTWIKRGKQPFGHYKALTDHPGMFPDVNWPPRKPGAPPPPPPPPETYKPHNLWPTVPPKIDPPSPYYERYQSGGGPCSIGTNYKDPTKCG